MASASCLLPILATGWISTGYDLRTKQLKQLTSNAPGMGVPFWSPDQQTIVFTVHQGDQSSVYFMNADGTGQHKASFR